MRDRPAPDPARLTALLREDGRSRVERARLVNLMATLAALPPPPDPVGLYPRYVELRESFLHAAAGRDGERLEEAFLELYCHLHGTEAPYTRGERRRLDETGGYWCHAGGLAPVLKAPEVIRPATRSVDMGAGNGLQLLLVQLLVPHALSVQVEISSRMVEAGRALQSWLGIASARVEWRCADVLETSVAGFDFVYLYRPVKPEGPGVAFYRRLAAELASAEREVVVFSVADCLRDYVCRDLEVFHHDGHLTCLRRRGGPAAGHRAGGGAERISNAAAMPQSPWRVR
jgi:hypothetical protein